MLRLRLPRSGGPPAPVPPAGPPSTPWRAEGLPPTPDRTKHPARRPHFWTVLLAIYLISLVVSSLFNGASETAVAYTDFSKQVAAGNVKEVYATGNTIEGTLRRPAAVPGGTGTYTHLLTERPTFANDNLYQQLTGQGVVVRAQSPVPRRSFLANLLVSLAPLLLLGGLWFLVMRRMQRSGGLGGLGGLGGRMRGSTPVAADTVRATFEDVAGIDEVEDELAEVVDFLRHPDKYRALGARVPRGVLLAGAPGTGKTLLARAVAGEAGVPFFSASAAEFIEMIVGVGAQRVRTLFEEARKVAPAIIFIDEIDSIGRSRGGPALGGNDEREQTLNQILTEMDGFTGSEGVVVIGATNRPEVLDSALLRPGRFDRSVTVNPPDVAGREAILRVHTRSVPLSPAVDLTAVARTTPGMTGAELANLVNEAALLAARRGRSDVTPAELSDALERVQLGAARAVIIPESERERTAHHESGHALLGMLRPGADPVRKVSIIPRGRALGVTLSTPDNDRYAYDEEYLRGRIIGALGGLVAEQVVYGVVTSGAESDLEQVSRLARAMVGRWGMSPRIGPLSVLPGPGQEGYPPQAGPALLNAVDEEARRIVEECRVEAEQVLREHRASLDALTRALLEHETLDEADAYAAAGVQRTPAATQGWPGRAGTSRD